MAKGWSFDSLVKALKGGAFLDVGKTKETVAAGDDSRIVNALQKGNNLSDVASVEDSRKNLGVFPQHGYLQKMDLNDLDGRLFGVWLQNSDANTEGNNYPDRVSGTLMVLKNGVRGELNCTQLYYPYNRSKVFWVRYKVSNAGWSEWNHFESSNVLRPLITTAQNTANNANTNANGRVPNTRKVNGKALSADITLTAGDVGAATPAQVNEAKTAASNAQTTANNANTNANGRVPNTRKVNGKQLNADITLNAGDVGALTPAQGDVRYAKIGKGIGAGVKLIYDGSGYAWNKKMSFGGNFSGAWLMTQVNDRVIPLFPILDFAYNTYVQTGYDSAIQYKIEKDGITVIAGQGATLKKVWVVGV